jgi:hypothetical protein
MLRGLGGRGTMSLSRFAPIRSFPLSALRPGSSAAGLARLLRAHALLAALCLAAGCSTDPATAPEEPEPEPSPDPAPDFSLRDVNATSARFDQMVSPRDYQGGVSAWYFGHAT